MQQLQQPQMESFLKALRTDATRESYSYVLRRVLKDPDAFLKLEKKQMEDALLAYIADTRGKVAGSTLGHRIAVVRSFLDFYEVALNWKKVKGSLPAARHVSLDRAPTVEEIRELLKFCGPRERAMVLMMCSGGFRVGSWSYFSVKDVAFLDNGLARIRVYRGEPEEYKTLVSSEAADALGQYLETRRRAGEKVGPDSPLIRDRWSYEQNGQQKTIIAPEVAHLMRTSSIQSCFLRLWSRAGVRTRGQGRGDFKILHGFRKFHKTQLSKAGVRWEDQEVLLGHYLNYYKPTLEHLEEEYLKALPYLSIDEKFSLKVEIEAKDKEHTAAWKDMRLEVLTLKDENKELQKTQARILELLRSGAKVDPRLLDLRPEDVDTSA